MHGLFKNVIIPFKIKMKKSHTHSFVPRPLIFKLQQVVLNFDDICVSWSSPKTDLETSFLNLENRSFENVSFSQYYMLDIPLLINLLISLIELKNIH